MSDVVLVKEDDGIPESKLPSWAVCSVCSNVAAGEEVRLMPCLHLICSAPCLELIKIENVVRNATKTFLSCKVCAKRHLESEVGKGAYILECQERERLAATMKEFKNPKCSYCIRGDNAVSWCGACDEYMCASCNDHHGYATRTRDHETETVEQKYSATPEQTDTSYTKCSLHSSPLTKFCTTCVAILCEVCCSKRHIGHATESLKDMAAETRSTIQRSLNQIKSMLPRYQQMGDVLANKAEHMLKTQYTFLVTEASAQLTRLLSALMKREMEQRKELTETVIHKAKEFNIKRLKVKSLIAQTKHFINFSEDLLKDGSDWAIISNRQLIETQLYNLMGKADQFSSEGGVEEFIEKGFNFVMDKSVGHQAERHVNLTAKISYSFNPKAPSEIKMSSTGMQSRNMRSSGGPQNESKNSNLPNQSKLVAQNSPPAPSPNVALRSYAKTPKSDSQVSLSTQVAGPSTRQSKTPRKTNPATPLANQLVKLKGNSILADQYANLTDQLIIEPIDEDSDIEDERAKEYKSDGNDTDIIQENNDDQDHGSKSRAKRGRPRSRPPPAVRNQNAGKSKSYKGENGSSEFGILSAAVSDSDSEEGCRNDAPSLSPESMKAPPKLRRVAESRKSGLLRGDDAESPIDTPPPVLVPSINIPGQRTSGVKVLASSLGMLRRCVSTSNLSKNTGEDAWGETNTDNAQEQEFGPLSRRSRRKSGIYAQNSALLSDGDTPALTSKRRGSAASEMGDAPSTAIRSSRSRSRCRMEVVPSPPPPVELPSKRERKKKSDPQFVEASLITRKRGKSSCKESGTPPTPNTSSPPDNKRGRRRGRGRGRRRKSVGRPRKSTAASDWEDDCN